MAGEIHKFFCEHCQRALTAENSVMLARVLNRHNDQFHPLLCCSWDEKTIIASDRYSRSFEPPSYLAPFITPETREWGGANPPNITERDKIMLGKGCVKWD